MKRKYSLYLSDIIQAIEKIAEFTAGYDFERFLTDDKTNSAVIRKIEIIGEAVKQIPESITATYDEIPWKQMARIRDKLIHGYFGLDLAVVWEVVNYQLPALKNKFKEIYTDLLKSDEAP
ncbi:MAG: DUF86 domain-containing protein [Desulfosalsimonadaceae bacterium]